MNAATILLGDKCMKVALYKKRTNNQKNAAMNNGYPINGGITYERSRQRAK